MKSFGTAGLLLVLLVTAAAQEPDSLSAEQAETRLHQAVLAGTANELVLEHALALSNRFPDRPYPLAILGDTHFRMRRLREATRIYQKALERINANQRGGPLGRSIEENLERANAELADFEKGLRQERRARMIGWGSLAILAGLVAAGLFLFRRP